MEFQTIVVVGFLFQFGTLFIGLVSHFLHQFVACCVCACVYLGVYIRQAGKKGYISEVVGALLSASLMHSHHGVRAGWP